jgi:hypothetical protein
VILFVYVVLNADVPTVVFAAPLFCSPPAPRLTAARTSAGPAE